MSLVSPRTAQELYDYAHAHGLICQVSKSWSLKHFGLIADSLKPDEIVLTTFVGFHNYKSMSKHDGCFAYAITNKRFILAQKKLIGGDIQTISIQNVNDITLNKKLLSHIITIDTIKETFNVEVSEGKTAENINTEVHNALEKAKSGSAMPGNSHFSSQLIELKKLLDAGIITQHEFDAKKKQILGL